MKKDLKKKKEKEQKTICFVNYRVRIVYRVQNFLERNVLLVFILSLKYIALHNKLNPLEWSLVKLIRPPITLEICCESEIIFLKLFQQ